jgi:hypothetical protein
VDDHVAEVEEFEVREGEIEGVEQGTARFGQLEGNLVEMPAEQQDAQRDHEADGAVGGRGGKNDRAEHDERREHPEHEPVEHKRLGELEPVHFRRASGVQQPEEGVEHEQAETAGQPAAEEFAEHHMGACDGLGEQGENRPILALGGNLARGGGDGDDEGRHPDEQEADFLEVTGDVRGIEKVDAAHDDRDERRKDEQDVEVLAADKFLEDDDGQGPDGFHVSWRPFDSR